MGVVANLTRSGLSRDFHREVPVVVPGNSSQADAEEAAYSRAQRYLVLRIFNISVGNTAAEMKPYEEEERMHEADLQTWKDALSQAPDDKSYASLFLEAHESAKARLDHLEIDLHALKCGSLAAAKVSFGKMYAKWRDANDADALKQITAGWEARKAAK
jgi:hypothetical protein